jgi:hypothetical protein
MSENLDLVGSIYEDWERGEFGSVEWAHPQIVFETHGFDGTNASGVAALGERWREWMRAWEEYRVEGDVLIDQHEVHVVRLRDGLVIELREFHEKRHALEAVWLEE